MQSEDISRWSNLRGVFEDSDAVLRWFDLGLG